MPAAGPRLMTGTLRTPFRVIRRCRWNGQANLRKGILVGVRPDGRIAPFFFECPAQDILLPKVAILEVTDPGHETHMPFKDRAETFVGIGFVAGNPRIELRHKTSM